MNELKTIGKENFKIFNKENLGSVRTVLVDSEVWFCIKDVCDILGLTNPTMVAQRLDADEQAKFDLGLLNKELMNFANESGLYTLILRSDKPEAKTFRKWITSEVIPSIRKTGNYSIQNPVEALLENPVKLGEMLIEYGKAKEQLKIQAPKVQTYEILYESDAVVDIGEVSKTLNFKGVGRNNLFAILRQQGILNSNNEPYQEYVNRGYFKLIPTNYVDNFGNRKMKVVAYMKGIEAISKLLLKLGYVKINPNYSMAIN